MSRSDTFARMAGYCILTGYAHHPGGAYSARNVARIYLAELDAQIAALTTNAEASGRGELPELRATRDLGTRTLAMLDALCPAV